MPVNHLIGSVTLDLHAPRKTDGFAMQAEVSKWFWQDVAPLLQTALDEVIPPELVLRVDRIHLDLSVVSRSNWKEELTQVVCRMLAEELIRRRLFPRVTDAPIKELPVALSRFEAWLDFLRTGHQPPSIPGPTEWQRNIPELIAESPEAAVSFRNLLRSQPTAVERLVRQYEEPFLIQLANTISRRNRTAWVRWRTAFQQLLAATWWRRLSETKTIDNQAIKQAFWRTVFEQLSLEKELGSADTWLADTHLFFTLLERLPQRYPDASSMALAIARFFHKEQSSKFPKADKNISQDLERYQAAFTSSDLRVTVLKAVATLPNAEFLNPVFEKILFENEKIIGVFLNTMNQTTPVEDDLVKISRKPKNQINKKQEDKGQQPSQQQSQRPFELTTEQTMQESNGIYYVQHAGVVLLHPFFAGYFTEVGLNSQKEPDRRRAAQLIHYLATGKTKTPEYELPLAKILASCPMTLPINGSIKIRKREKEEARSMLEMVISYWTALGKTSVDGLREGFLQREGKLSKVNGAWLLQIQRSTQDILLDQLPWGIGVVKNDWMEDFLYVEYIF